MRTGRDYLSGLRDGRVVFVGGSLITDITSHPGFGRAAETVAAIFDLKRDAASRDDLVVDDCGDGPYSAYYLLPRTQQDLARRRRCHERIAAFTCGMFGRSPDHVASLITGLAMQPEALVPAEGRDGSANLLDYYHDARRRDAYVAYAVLPGRPNRHGAADSGLRIVREDEAGVVLRGVKGLATAAVLADEVWIGNLQPIAGTAAAAEAVTCVVPCSAPGLTLWSRSPFAEDSSRASDRPLTWQYDEGDAVLTFDDVRVDWKRVFVHRDPARSADIYIRTPAHALANHQSSVRSLAKLRFFAGLAYQIALATGAAEVPAVRERLGRLAAFEATLSALVDAQITCPDTSASNAIAPNRRYVYAALNWCQEEFPAIVECLRDLNGAGSLKFPANVSVFDAPETAAAFERFWNGPSNGAAALDMRLFKLGWDVIGSEFAGRQQLYERFFAGAPAVVRGHNYREARWDEWTNDVRRVLDLTGAADKA
jgi:4-hydroxyphenylacetate 3-monooxygenase